MALKVKKTEHAGAKNGGGHWGSRSEAKSGAKQRRRQESKRIISNAVKTESEAVTKSARAEINRRLKQVEIDHGVKQQLLLMNFQFTRCEGKTGKDAPSRVRRSMHTSYVSKPILERRR